MTPDLAGEVKRLIDLGAVQQQEIEEGGYHWITLIEPAGNEFDGVAT